MTLSTISDHGGFPLWNVKTDGRDLAPDIYRALKFTVPHFNRSWNHPQNVTEDMERMDVLYHMGQRIYKSLQELEPAPEFATSRALYTCEPMFMMHDGIPPFWNLGLLPRKDYALPTEW
ncbi:hypothetical protein SARC_08341 [Sphaeroforma arctica JP610]|uniref:Uncharacterized protein n=1 Tax=Sphaeroforma arctica JP610 TaxID=667725 RepID=A0A0L0FRR1_9EUKA|nr:hypothetical protein SARC_08341 [Sphaeroforma arctica JP610]KNC79256.1 hypothetical protein SARC_08341 [Sphaeroforma arctica JP610]|eukprot:XP_014153158.1 hypothetical protein SARC_08341 [Sphaeroforma arctica JP610]